MVRYYKSFRRKQNVYSNFLEDALDKEHVLTMFNKLVDSLTSNGGKLSLNGVELPTPSGPPTESEFVKYADWLEEQLPERQFSTALLDLHPKQILMFEVERASLFIDELSYLWLNCTTLSGTVVVEDADDGSLLHQDRLHIALKMCAERLPRQLPVFDNEKKIMLDLRPENAIAFALFKV